MFEKVMGLAGGGTTYAWRKESEMRSGSHSSVEKFLEV